MKIAVDSNIVIYAIESDAELHLLAASFFDSPLFPHQVYLSALVYLEVLSHKKIDDAHAASAVEHVKKIGSVHCEVNEAVLFKAAELRRKHLGLKTPDAIHIASAVLHGCEFFVTNDIKLVKLKVAGIKIVGLEEFVSKNT